RLNDPRDLFVRPDSFVGKKIAVRGQVFNIEIGSGMTFMQLWIWTSSGTEAVVVWLDEEVEGVYKNSTITVYGRGDGSFTGTNAFGGQISQPQVAGDFIEF